MLATEVSLFPVSNRAIKLRKAYPLSVLLKVSAVSNVSVANKVIVKYPCS